MYAIPNACRVYITSIFLLCAAFFLAPTVANANVPTTLRPDLQDMVREVQKELNRDIKRPVNSTLSTAPSAPTVSKNPAGGLSTSTNQILKEMGRSTDFSSTANYSATAAKNALKSCVRSPACATKALGTVGVIYEGVQGWISVYDFLFDEDKAEFYREQPFGKIPPNPEFPDGWDVRSYPVGIGHSWVSRNGYVYPQNAINVSPSGNYYSCKPTHFWAGEQLTRIFVGGHATSNGITCYYALDSTIDQDTIREPVSLTEIDQAIDQSYEPEPSDFPVLVSDSPQPIILSEPESLTLSTPAPVELPATTTTTTDSQGKTNTSVTNAVLTYNIINNNSLNPSIDRSVTETTTTYDEYSNIMNTSTSTTTDKGVQHDTPSSGASVNSYLPPFCTYASIVCDWIGWTKEDIEGEEPDLINLISEFEPDEQQYNSGIGSGSCPAPMSLNLGIINRTVEVSYQPFCDFLDMIRPLVISGAWLLSAFMYVGVLRRG